MDYLIDALIISGVFLWSEIKTNDKAGLFSINKKLRGYSKYFHLHNHRLMVAPFQRRGCVTDSLYFGRMEYIVDAQ